AVRVGGAEGGDGWPTRAGGAGLCRHIRERAVSVVVIEPVGSEAGHVEVFPPVVVVIARRDAHSPSGKTYARFVSDIGESPVAIIAPQFTAGAVWVGGGGDRRRVDEIDVQPAVVVVVGKRYAAAHGFEDASLIRRKGVLEGDAARPRDIGADNAALRWGE